jgi:hypothetical protein
LGKKAIHIFSVVLTIFILVGCSRKKDKALNRGFHALTTKYNVLYNGNLAYESGKNALIESFNDDYWEVLPVERMEVKEDLFLPGASKNPDFERAEEKAVKAIQKHGMNIGGREKNQQTDEAYLLLGKARYFDQRFVPALEAFNYILYKHPTSDKINHARIWREKVNIRLENTDLAIKNLKRLIKLEELSEQDVSDANAMLAQAYLNNKHLDSAIAPIKLAVESTKNKEIRGRLGYIKGQIYNKLGYKDSANIAFDEIIKLKRKTLWVYYVNAQVAKARSFDFEKGDKQEYSEYLTKLSEDREYKSYLDKIYNLMAVYHKNTTSDSLATVFYNKSIRKGTSDTYLQSLNYRALAEYQFDATNYKSAGAYYDSTMTKLKMNSKEYRFFKKKKDNLVDVIAYEDMAKRNDSILKILNYSDDERITYFEKHITGLKEKEAAEKAAKEEALVVANTNSFLPGSGGKKNTGSTFYFYNSTTVAYGKEEFRKIWGDRTLEDNWRIKNKNIIIPSDDKDELEDTAVVKEELKDIYTPEYYITQLPATEKQKDSVITKRNFAYYQLGLIYKQKFKEYALAGKRLEKLITFKPNERLALPAKYQLYKIYTELESNKKENVKQDIIANYPDSRYAEILRNPDALLTFSEGSPKVVYEKLYKQFENQEFELVSEQLDKYITQFDGDEMLPKYELLKAIVNGKIDGFEAYKKGINYVALNYPNAEEGKSAQTLLQKSIPGMNNSKFVDNTKGVNFKLVYVFDKTDPGLKTTKEGIEKALKNTYRDYLKVSKDFYNREQAFIVVHGFITAEVALGFHNFLDENKKKYKPGKVFVTPSSDNYRIIQIHKKLAEFQNPKPTK